MSNFKRLLLQSAFCTVPFFSVASFADEILYAHTNSGGQGVAGCIYSQNCTQETWGVDLNDNTGYRWTVARGLEGASTLSFKLASLSGTRKMSLWVNGEKVRVIEISSSAAPRPTGNTFGPYPVFLSRGNNQIELRDTEGTTEFDIHQLEIKESQLSKVEILTTSANDHVRILKDGIPYQISKLSNGVNSTWQDISYLFHNGTNIFDLQGVNMGGATGFNVALRVNGTNTQNFSCSSTNCGETNDAAQAIVLDQEVQLNNLVRPFKHELEITSYESGKIYINDQYTGLSTPNSIQLTPGTYKVGLGIDNGTNQPKYLEKKVSINNGAKEVEFFSNDSPIINRNVVKIGVLPIRTGTGGGMPISTTLTNAEITKIMSNLAATNSQFVQHFSYGLSTWNFTLLPTVEETFNIEQTCSVLERSTYSEMLQEQYDVIMVVHSQKKPDGTNVFDGNGGYSTGQCVSFADASLPNNANAPSELVVHEMLHQYEGIQGSRINTYIGVEGVHGPEEHGYTDVNGWAPWYELFMRGQVGEISTMRAGQNQIPVPVSNPEYFIGSFNSIMFGFSVTDTISHYYGKCIGVASGLSYPTLGTKVTLQSDCKNHAANFSLLPNGVLQHNLSGYCVVAENGQAINNKYAVLSSNCTADTATQFSLTPAGSLKHTASGRCLHPEGGGYSDPDEGTPLLFHDGCDENRLKFTLN